MEPRGIPQHRGKNDALELTASDRHERAIETWSPNDWELEERERHNLEGNRYVRELQRRERARNLAIGSNLRKVWLTFVTGLLAPTLGFFTAAAVLASGRLALAGLAWSIALVAALPMVIVYHVTTIKHRNKVEENAGYHR